MSYYDDIYEYAADNYGLITSKEAKNIGIPNIELVKLCGRGRLTRLGHGVYRIVHYVPTPLDKYAEAIAITGYDAHIYGESVLAMHGLALVNPPVIYVATTNIIRKSLPPYIVNILANKGGNITLYENIPSQSVFDAIRTVKISIMSDRLKDAIKDAEIQGLISNIEATILKKEIKNGNKSSN